ncbi:MAG: hypothetical protein ABIK08_15010, partial [Pseudomonadota bacterium]
QPETGDTDRWDETPDGSHQGLKGPFCAPNQSNKFGASRYLGDRLNSSGRLATIHRNVSTRPPA